MGKKGLGSAIKSCFWIVAASAIFSFGFNWCYVPNQISLGGITGLGQIINAAVPAIPIGIAVIVLNIPLFLLSWKYLGGRLLLSSLFAMAATSLGVADNAVALPTTDEAWRFEVFSVEDYQALYQQMVDGTLVVDDDYTVLDNPETATNWSNVNLNII